MNKEKDFYDYIEERWVLLPHPMKVLVFSFTTFFLFIIFSYLLCWKLRCYILCTDSSLAKRKIKKFFRKLKKKLKKKRIIKKDEEGSLDSSENLYNEVKKSGSILSKEPNLSTNSQVENSSVVSELKNSELLSSSKISKKISQADENKNIYAPGIKNKINSQLVKEADYESLISDVYYLDSKVTQTNDKPNQVNLKSNIKSKLQKTSILSSKSLSFLSTKNPKKKTKTKLKEDTNLKLNSKINQKEDLKSKLISKANLKDETKSILKFQIISKNETKSKIKSTSPPEIKSKVSPSKISGFSALYAINTKQVSDKSSKQT